MATPIKMPATVATVVEHDADTRSFVLTAARPVPRFRPGQFLHLALDAYDPAGHWPDSRVFSIASPPQERDRLRVTVSRKGSFTRRMFDEMRVGTSVWVKLPYGSFCPEMATSAPTVFVAGGTGVTPFISFLEAAAVAQATCPIHVHYGARRPDLLIYREALTAISARLPSLRLTLYAEDPAGAGGDGVLPGRLSAPALLAPLVGDGAAAATVFYLSGPKAMIDAIRGDLLARGTAPAAVRVDEWG
jgi:ferredoxin-NADP reductase